MTLSFSAQVDAWARKSEKRMTAIFREAAQLTFADAQLPVAKGGRMRVDTGFLRASFSASKSSIPSMTMSNPDRKKKYEASTSVVALVIAGAKIGDHIYAGWGANYAAAREYGGPDAFMRGAAERWQEFVRKATRKAKAIA
jgi:hypothetical protein